MTPIIRPYQTKDLDAVYDICLKTGDAGQDATHLYQDPKVLGHMFAGPYVTLEPELTFVLEDEAGVCGYVLGVLDTQVFHQQLAQHWLPPLQAQYPDPQGDPDSWTHDEKAHHHFHHPKLDLPVALKPYPSHLHIDLLPRAQGQGHGRQMMQTLLQALRESGSVGVHLGLGKTNTRALRFYQKIGFCLLQDESLSNAALWMGMHFDERN